MKLQLRHSGILLVILGLIISCGPSEEEQQRREQARQDSLEQVRQDSLDRIRQQRQDSLAQAKADSAKKRQEQTNVNFTDSGNFTVQAASWRSEVKAQQEAEMWKERGFNNAFVVQHGNKATGDVWYRVRLGRVETRQDAEQLQQNLQDEYQTQSWIATTR